MQTCTRCYKDTAVCECPEPGSETDVYGRVWRHCEEGLSMTKASMARFMMFCLKNNVEIGSVHAFNANYHGCQVMAAIRIKPEQIAAFEADTGGKLRRPPRLVLN